MSIISRSSVVVEDLLMISNSGEESMRIIKSMLRFRIRVQNQLMVEAQYDGNVHRVGKSEYFATENRSQHEPRFTTA